MTWDHKEVFDDILPSAVHAEAEQRVVGSAHEATSQLGMDASDWSNAGGLAGLKMVSNLTLNSMHSRVFAAAREGSSVNGQRALILTVKLMANTAAQWPVLIGCLTSTTRPVTRSNWLL